MGYKKIIGKRIYLSPISSNNYKLYTEWVNDFEVMLGLSLNKRVITEESQKSFLESSSGNKYDFGIIALESDKLIGNVGFTSVDQINRKATVGIFIGDKEYWNDGYGGEALSLLLDFGFNVLNLNSINLTVFEYNKPAIRCYEKIGFKEAGRLREAVIAGGQKFAEIEMDILAREFESPVLNDILNKRMNR